MVSRGLVIGVVGLALGCGGKVAVDERGEGGAGPTPSTTGTGNSQATGGAGGGIIIGGGGLPQSESCDAACDSISGCLDIWFDCGHQCAQDQGACEEVADEYLACVLQDQVEACTFAASCSELALAYLDCRGLVPRDGGCVVGDDGSCSCEVSTMYVSFGSECVDDQCNCFNESDLIGSCDNSLSQQCDPLANCCSSMNVVVGYPPPVG